MHESIMSFGHRALTPEMVEGKRVLEVGALNVNGSLRQYVESMGPESYTGVDFQGGSGVDVVMDFCEPYWAARWVSYYDLVISTEMLEHAEDWRTAITNMKAVLKPGGWLLLTTRSEGFPRHGYPDDYWRFDAVDMNLIFSNYTRSVSNDPQVPGVFVLAQKPYEETFTVDLSGIDVYSMKTGRRKVSRNTVVATPRMAGMLRVRNESRWIKRVIESIKSLCDAGIFILDDKSTDTTVSIATQCGAIVIKSDAPGIDETRDKNRLLKHIMEVTNPDWVLHIDGDEELEPAGIDVIHKAIMSGKADMYGFQILYLWDKENQIRTDGIFGRMWRQSLFATANTDGVFKPTTHGANTSANLHCTNVPYDLVKRGSINIDARLIHYGYIDRDMRLKKWDFYNTIDPDNLIEDRYRHAVTGDIPEVPANVITKWAGPLTLKSFYRNYATNTFKAGFNNDGDYDSRRYLAYAAPGPPVSNSTLEYIGCKNPDCERYSCTASAMWCSKFCCPHCASGMGHTPECDESLVYMKSLLIESEAINA